MKGIWGLAAVGLLLATSAMAQDKTQFEGDGSFATAPAFGASYGEVDRLVSLRGNASVQIGGAANITTAYSTFKTNAAGTFINALDGMNEFGVIDGRFNASEWQATKLELDFLIKACDSISFNLKLDFSDPWYAGTTYDQDQLVKEAYFTLDKLCGTGFGLNFGKMEVPFGMNNAKPDLVMESYIHNGSSYLNTSRNGLDSWGDFAMPQWGEINAVPWLAHSTSYDRTFAFAPFYSVCDTFKVEAAIFQDRLGRRNGGIEFDEDDRIRASRHTDDPGASFAARLTYTPTEALAIYASGVSRYNRSFVTREYNDGSWTNTGEIFYKKRMHAVSVGFDYTYDICGSGRVFNLFSEWQHAWNPDFFKETRSDNIHAGIAYSVTNSLKLFAQFEYLRTNYKPVPYKEFVRRGYLAAQYELSQAAFLEAGFQREWYKTNANELLNGNRIKAYSNVVYASMGLRF